MTDDVKIPQRLSQAYRELGAEEPPRALDEAILAAARRSRRRWATPLATAAVLVLAVAVTLNMQRERPGVESPVKQSPPRADRPRLAQEAEYDAGGVRDTFPSAARHHPRLGARCASPGQGGSGAFDSHREGSRGRGPGPQRLGSALRGMPIS